MFDRKLLYCYIVFAFLCFCVFAYPAEIKAAILSLEAGQAEYNVGDIFMADVILDSQGEYINAVEVKIKFDPKILRAEDFSNGNSILTLMVEQPIFSNQGGEIFFAGGIPNGFEGKKGLLGRIVFKATAAGSANIEFLSGSRTLLNNGAGGKANLKFSGLAFTINPLDDERSGADANIWQKFIDQDVVSPESFKIYLNKDPAIFNGQHYIIFFTADKQTGVSYYEIKEGNSNWQIEKSPYLLKDQSLSQKIYVKAVDKAGNERIEIMHPKFYFNFSAFEKISVWSRIIIIAWLAVLCYILIKLVRSVKKRSK